MNLKFVDLRINNLYLGPGSPAVVVLSELDSRGVYSLILGQVNSSPFLTSIPNQVIHANTATEPILLDFFDQDSDPCSLNVFVSSSNPALIPNAALKLNGFCSTLSLTATPVEDGIGTATITVIVQDFLGASAGTEFTIEVVADAPASPLIDPRLETILSELLEKPPGSLTLYDLRSLLHLEAVNKGLTNLEGLQLAIHLKLANLASNSITDFTVLGELPDLERVILDDNPVANISFLNALTKLRVLSLQNTGLQDISHLTNLINLNSLDLSYNLIPNVELVSSLSNLQELILDGAGLHDISFISNLPGLTSLSIANNDIGDLVPLLDLPNLQYLSLSGNNLNLEIGSPNEEVVATLQSRGVYIPNLEQSAQPAITTYSPGMALPDKAVIQFFGIPGRTYTVQASTNLVSWIDVATINSTSKLLTYTDPSRSTFKHRFYRILATSLMRRMAVGMPRSDESGNVVIPVFGVGNEPFVLQTSPDLVQWTSLATNTALNGSICIDGAATNHVKRFYRLAVP